MIKELQQRGVDILNMGLLKTPIETNRTNLFLRTIWKSHDFERTQRESFARERGDFKEGRPRKFNPAKVDEALNYIESGNSYKKASEVFGISKTTLIRRMQERKANKLKERNTMLK